MIKPGKNVSEYWQLEKKQWQQQKKTCNVMRSCMVWSCLRKRDRGSLAS